MRFLLFSQWSGFSSVAIVLVQIRVSNMGRRSSHFCEQCAVKCKDCEMKYQTKFCINLHRSKHNITCSKKRKFKCSVCLKTFKNVANFLLHKTFHDQNKRRKLSPNGTQSCGAPTTEKDTKEKVKDEEVQKSSRRKQIPRRLVEQKCLTADKTANNGCLGPSELICKSPRPLGKQLHCCYLSRPSRSLFIFNTIDISMALLQKNKLATELHI